MEFLDRARGDQCPPEELRGREILVRPDPREAAQVMEEERPTVGQALGLGRVQVFGLQAVAVWVPFLGQRQVPELALLGRSVLGSVPDLVLGLVREKEAEPAGTVSRAKMRSSEFSAP